MKMKIALIIQILLLTINSTFCIGQSLKICDTNIKNSEYYINDTKYITTTITLKNSNSKGVVLWLSEKDAHNMTSREKIRDYFFQIKGDFSLAQLMTDNDISLASPILYVSFFKYLAPNESFSIIILSKEFLEKDNSSLTNRINSVEIDSFNNLIEINVLKNFSYKSGSICFYLESFDRGKKNLRGPKSNF